MHARHRNLALLAASDQAAEANKEVVGTKTANERARPSGRLVSLPRPCCCVAGRLGSPERAGADVLVLNRLNRLDSLAPPHRR